MEPTTLDMKAYNLYYDYRKENNLETTTFYYFITHKELEKYNKFYRQALKQMRTKKLNKINNKNIDI